VVAKGFEHAWDIGFLPDGRALVTERPGRISIVSGLREGATRTTVEADLDDLFVSGEGGLMGMVVHPDFATSRLFTTCQTHQENGQPKDVPTRHVEAVGRRHLGAEVARPADRSADLDGEALGVPTDDRPGLR
jgi:glucose/arabinose dehydrogenase